MPRNGSPSTIKSTELASAMRPGRAITARESRYQAPDCAGRASRPAARRSRRGASAFTRGPSSASTAGSTSSATAAAISETIIPPMPIE